MSRHFIFYDTETTGLKSDQDRIIEIAAYDPIANRTFSELINPQIPIPPDSILIHNITEEMIKNASTFAEIGKKFIDFCSEDTVLIAHNNHSFDLPFLRSEFERHSLSLPSSWTFIDSLKWARKYRYDLPRHSLQYLREIYEIPPNQAHRALNDVMVLAEVFQRMTGDLPIDIIHSLLQEPIVSLPSEPIQHMPFGKYSGTPLMEIPQSYIDWLSKNGIFDKEENQSLKDQFIQIGRLKT